MLRHYYVTLGLFFFLFRHAAAIVDYLPRYYAADIDADDGHAAMLLLFLFAI